MSKNRVKKRFTSDVNVIDFQQTSHVSAKKHRVTLLPRNKNQEDFVFKLQDPNKSIIFAIGPAGTGKTLLAVQHGIKLFQEGKVDKIVITRPAVSVDEELGFLPGTLEEKMAPWTRPIFDILHEYYHPKDVLAMMEDGAIEIAPLAFMRGRTFKNAYIIADEIQNATPNQTKMLLTRIGQGSRMVVTGDLAQADKLHDNGLLDFVGRIEGRNCHHIDIVRFDKKDVERHEAVTEVLDLYGDE